jgi:hypothetical protein
MWVRSTVARELTMRMTAMTLTDRGRMRSPSTAHTKSFDPVGAL